MATILDGKHTFSAQNLHKTCTKFQRNFAKPCNITDPLGSTSGASNSTLAPPASGASDGAASSPSSSPLRRRSVWGQVGPHLSPLELGAQQQQQQRVSSGASRPQALWLPGGQLVTFSIEPPPLVEFSNSTGATIHCRWQLQTVAAKLQLPQAHQQHAQQVNERVSKGGKRQERPHTQRIVTSWRRVDAEGQLQEAQQSAYFLHEEGAPSEMGPGDTVLGGSGAADHAGGPKERLVRVKPDGSLELRPFAADQLEPAIHAAHFSCCLTSAQTGHTMCSRPVRTKAGKCRAVGRRHFRRRRIIHPFP